MVSEYDEISSLTNPTVKRVMLLDFADSCDGAVVHLKAAALPRQKTQVILPITDLPDNEIYAPNFKNGEKVALVRYPHGGTFEIPTLMVNNRNEPASRILGNAADAVGINPKVAKRLSGADFDGDQVVVIPVGDKVRIKSTPALAGLKDFDPKDSYPYQDGMRVMTKANTQKQMGAISNLITDMTLKGATESELTRAIKHSMVVIDAEKHSLNYKQSEKDNGIAELSKLYQGYAGEGGKRVGGASTLLSRRKQEVSVPERQGSGKIDPQTGKVAYKTSGRSYIDKKTGKEVPATSKVKLLDYVDDIRTISSGTPQENAYADYANKMKALANQARKEYKVTAKLSYSSSAKSAYQKEFDSLSAKLNVAAKNAPLERNAQAIANSVVKAKIQDNPDLGTKAGKSDIKKLKAQAITDARTAVGASGKGTRITITDKEWEAIQAGAISDNNLLKILRYTDQAEIKQRATPRATSQLSAAKITKIKAMANSGYTNAEIAEALGVSTTAVSKSIKS
jgi:hypothetical protein